MNAMAIAIRILFIAISPILFEYGTANWNFHSNQRTKKITCLRNLKYYLREQYLLQKKKTSSERTERKTDHDGLQ